MRKLYIFLIFLFLVIVGQILYINIVNGAFYKEEFANKTNTFVYASSAKRGRILDVNGNVLVDNEEVYDIYYVKSDSNNFLDEIEIAKVLADTIDSGYEASDDEIKEFLMITTDTSYLLTDDELVLIDERKLTDEEVNELIISRLDITDYDDSREYIYFYLLMNDGFSYDKKTLISDISYEEFAYISEFNLTGVLCETSFVRIYPYGDVLSSIFGSVGNIYEEDAEYYLSLGYELNDIVGLSYLEKEYEWLLKGEKAVYKVSDDGSLTLIKEEVAGSDLYLSIDINVQLELEEIMESEMIIAKNYANTQYFTDSYAAVSDPSTGEIIAISAKRLIDNDKNYSFTDITNEVLSSSFTIGSVVKAASMSVGYNYGLIDTDEYIIDSCVKLNYVPQKCSWKSLGSINDVSALKLSSNYYQYILAIRLTGNIYSYDMSIDATVDDFDIYRDTFSEFGLGSYTGIDLPGEQTGVTGTTIADDLLLNLAIGQYDTYTLLQILQYINTLANNKERLELSLAKEAYNSFGELVFEKNNLVLNTLSVEDEYYERIIEGLSQVVSSGTGYGYIDASLNPIGKTGTSESFLDSNNDGDIDVKTYTKTFVGYASNDEEKYSVAVITPHISYDTGSDDDYIYNLSRLITLGITNYLFDIS